MLMADKWIGGLRSYTGSFPVARRGAVGGKDVLSLDLNDSAASRWTSGVLAILSRDNQIR